MEENRGPVPLEEGGRQGGSQDRRTSDRWVQQQQQHEKKEPSNERSHGRRCVRGCQDDERFESTQQQQQHRVCGEADEFGCFGGMSNELGTELSFTFLSPPPSLSVDRPSAAAWSSQRFLLSAKPEISSGDECDAIPKIVKTKRHNAEFADLSDVMRGFQSAWTPSAALLQTE
ncbi:hypothetical protein MPTK1_1g29010 [Marchantia polymorpha subsp. ruderalis]|uniref:Uncharacterized protein n=2 Tax=Marchantia polymorpha TaxID=3197 RepID=A0AAF6AVE5_MARPO|nr:hypothetical protein MARPO_0107s0017 [Marchantia polymorpha]BBN00416.1 hypothetical protein Mp_1g29010 [Marchantia polymorpha subsp. ruderalis]|eukprot:PTQ31745.1 hypothetical protein MARPO_0107s0017 [Marchantia polymorpha]